MSRLVDKAAAVCGNSAVWAMLGGALLLNSFIAKFLFPDGGVNSALCGSAALFFLIPPLLKIVHDDFKHNRVHMNELVLVAVVAGISRGDMLTAGLIAFFLLIGLIIETRSASGARESLEKLAKMTSTKARRVNADGSEQTVEPAALAPGDILRARPGEIVPADGDIIAGDSSFNEASVTGESLPADKGPGDKVFAGTINLTGAVDFKVTKLGAETTLGKVKELILAAERSRPRFVRMIDEYAKYYTPLTLMLAFFVWAVSDHDMARVVAVLVAACPVALVLSTPSAAVAALSAGARLGVLIKKISDIEAFSSITTFVFDKTGTLTSGVLEVAELAPADGVESAELLAAAAAAEQHSNHPVAAAVRRLRERTRVPLATATNVHEEPGKGIRAETDDGVILVGNLRWTKENGVDETAFPNCHDEANTGMSMLFVVKNGKALGWIALEDMPRPGAREALVELRESGIRHLSMVTGDRNGVAVKVARELGIEDFQGECSPSDKIERVKELKALGHRTVFVGDGVNDAPALAASDIGVAMGAAGSDLAVETATIALMNNELNRLPFLSRLARSYKNVMFQNFLIGALFIVGGVVAGASGNLKPVLAAFLQVASAIFVVMNSARLIRSGETLSQTE